MARRPRKPAPRKTAAPAGPPPIGDLIAAARAGDLERVLALVDAGADPNAVSVDLAVAVDMGREPDNAKWVRRKLVSLCRERHPHEARALAVAETLGEVELTSSAADADGDEIAWGVFVTNASAFGSPLAIGVSAACSTLVLLAGDPDQVLASTVIAKTLARAGGARMSPGTALAPTTADFGDDRIAGSLAARWKLEAPAHGEISDAVFAQPVPGRTFAMQDQLTLLQRCAERLSRLAKLGAPETMVATDHQNIVKAWGRLTSLGWSEKADPLPREIMKVIRPVVAAPARR